MSEGTEPTTEPTDPPETEPTGTDGKDWQAEAEKWKALARKHEGSAKSNAEAAKRLAEIEESQKTDLEKAVGEAEQRGRQAAKLESAQERAAAKIEAALTGVVEDPAAFIDDLNLAKFVTADGDVDAEAVAALRAKYEPLASKKRPNLGQGNRGSDPVAQLTAADLEHMTPEQIVKAREEGRLDNLLGKTQ